jgi:hypothetical protein
MAIRKMADVASAFDEGRFHQQRFYKGALTAGDTHWQDWSYGAGQPSYDARIGTAGQFNPYNAQRNDAIYFPSINSDQNRHLTGITLQTVASGTNQSSVDVIVYDLLGVYPLIDGDSTDEQLFDNTETLPRYTDGKGVVAVMVNHVSPMIATTTAIMKYNDTDDIEKTVTVGVHLTGQNRVVSGIGGTLSVGSFALPFAAGSQGCKTINSLQFASAPGGLFAIYLLKPLTTTMNCDGNLTTDKIATEKEFSFNNAFHFPEIFDGAWLGMFLRPNGGARTINSVFGHMTFIWN